MWYMRCSCRQHTERPTPYICTACQQMFAIQDVTCHLVRCEPSGRELELVARESMRRHVAERILQLKNLRPPLYLLFAARPWAPVRRPTAVLPERTPLRQPRRLRDAADLWIRAVLGGDQVARGFSARAHIEQRGDLFSVVVLKTRDYFDFFLQGFFDSQEELAALRLHRFKEKKKFYR